MRKHRLQLHPQWRVLAFSYRSFQTMHKTARNVTAACLQRPAHALAVTVQVSRELLSTLSECNQGRAFMYFVSRERTVGAGISFLPFLPAVLKSSTLALAKRRRLYTVPREQRQRCASSGIEKNG